ncbi:MAG: hypothetical protein Q9198_004425 [Flavoplaca austrocitrina]
MDIILDGLNNAQLAAVTSPADIVQILAPPGSGKTRTLTSRVAYLIKHHNYKPWNILCLTFTIKSSREMKERLGKLIGNGTEAKLVLGTFHSVCRRYLVSYGHLIGIPKDFGIADSSDTLSIIKRILKRLRFSLDPRVAQSRISSCKSKGINVAKLSDDALKKKKVDQQEFAQVFESYEDQLDQGNLLDYDDLLLRCCDLLRQHPLCVSNVEAVLIDEFQDTNVVQFDLMRLFAVQRKRVTTVGDPDQSIYGWRSAEIKNLARMQTQYPETLVIHLQDNYRSSGAILLAAQELIQQDESRPSKPLLPTHGPGTLPVLRRLPSSDAEASWIVTEIIRMIGMTGGMLKHPDIAILLRSAALSRQIESAMGKAGIPYRMVGGQRFFDRVEIKILLDYLRVASQPTNNDAVARVVNIPARGVGTTTIKALLEEAETKKVTLWSLILDAVRGNIKTSTKINKPAEQGLGTFVQIILTAKQKLKDQVNPLSPQSLLRYIIKRLNFQDYIKRTYDIDSDGRWANVEELISQAGEFLISSNSNPENLEAINDTSLPTIEGIAQSDGDVGEKMLSTFLANVALATELQKDEGEEDGHGQAQVTISTIHAAKGLEWPVVFVPAAYEGSIPHSRAEDTDEERRLLYVAMTRAQALLYVSCPTRNSRGEESTLSQFLNPKTLGHYLVNVGPQIHTEFVNDVARILKRPCPSESKMLQGSLTLKSREDDLWPLDGQETLGQTKPKWESKTNAHQQNNLLSQCGHITAGKTINWDSISNTKINRSLSTAGNTTTMDNASSLTIHQLGGFVSATNQLGKQHRTREDVGESMAGRSLQALEGAPAPAKRKRKRKPQEEEAQSSLTSLWGLKRHNNENTARPLKILAPRLSTSLNRACYQSPTQNAASRTQSHSDPTALTPAGPALLLPTTTSILQRAPLLGIPENLAKHKLRPTMAPRPRPVVEPTDCDVGYAFLSSSPSLPEAATKGQPMTAESRSYGTNENAEAVESLGGDLTVQKDVRPSITAHTTSLAQLQAKTTTRKTLGVRRSMNGWNAKCGQGGRGGQSFSVPSRKE